MAQTFADTKLTKREEDRVLSQAQEIRRRRDKLAQFNRMKDRLANGGNIQVRVYDRLYGAFDALNLSDSTYKELLNMLTPDDM